MQPVVQRPPEPLTPESARVDPHAGGAAPGWASNCLNCGSALARGGHFCSRCGQRAAPPHPRLSELAGDAFAELSGWDGKFVETFRLLVLKPGELTRRFIEGQRARFIAPVRLYLTLSVVYFLVAASVPAIGTATPNRVTAGPIDIGVTVGPKTSSSGPGQAARAGLDARNHTITQAERDSALRQIAHAPRLMRPILERAVKDPDGFKRGVLENMPRVFFALLPVFAAILALFYRGRHFPEHLYFSLHLHSYAFLVLAIAGLTSFTRVLALLVTVQVIAQLSVPVYFYLALRRVYGGSAVVTVSKELGVGVIYGLAGAGAVLLLAYWAALAR